MKRTENGLGTAITIQAVTGRVPGGSPSREEARRAIEAAFDWVATFEEDCSRFRPESALMKANATPRRYHQVPEDCFEAIVEAQRAYEVTNGAFDPRVFGDLVRLGYDRTFSGVQPHVPRPEIALRHRGGMERWRPRFRAASNEVALGRHPIDLGGIGKGFAVRRMSRILRAAGVCDHIVDAGGDLYCAGSPPGSGRWMVGVEDPSGGTQPLAVLAVADLACATSSTRSRSWVVGERRVHHLIDPRNGMPAATGLAAVTVVDADPARAETWSKAVLLAGRSGALDLAARRAIAAVVVRNDGTVERSSAAERYLEWTRHAA